MRRGWILCAALLALACDETTTSLPVGVEGTHDLAIAGDLLFVTATDDDDLRVVDLSPPLVDQEFVRAPNPIFPLSIPVTDRPVALARDVDWTTRQELAGSYVYALSASGRVASVIGADPGSLREVATLRLTISGETITAIAARGTPGGPSTLYVATYDGSGTAPAAILREVAVPAPAALALGSLVEVNATAPEIARLPCAAVSSLLVLPDGKLAYASRPTRTTCPEPPLSLSAILDPSAPGTPVALQFPTAARRLFTHGAVEGAKPLAAASRIFAILDESSCGGAEACRGITAVVGPGTTTLDPREKCGRAVGDVACDSTGLPMIQLSVGAPLVMGAAIATGVHPRLEEHTLGTTSPRLTGTFTASDGRMVFFDADNLRPWDIDPETARLLSQIMFRPDGTFVDVKPVGEDPRPVLAEGAARTEEIHLVYLGDLPGFSALAREQPSATVAVADPAGAVAVGDLAYLTGEGCSGTTTVAARDASSVTLAAPLGGPGCRLSIRPPDPAAGTLGEWVVAGTVSGFLGRVRGTGAEVELPPMDPADPASVERRVRLFTSRPVTFDPAAPQALIRFRLVDPFGPGGPLEAVPEAARLGHRAVLTVDDGLAAAQLFASTEGRRFIRPDVAGAVAYKRRTDPDSGAVTGDLYVAFPSANVVIGVDLAGELRCGTTNSPQTCFAGDSPSLLSFEAFQ